MTRSGQRITRKHKRPCQRRKAGGRRTTTMRLVSVLLKCIVVCSTMPFVWGYDEHLKMPRGLKGKKSKSYTSNEYDYTMKNRLRKMTQAKSPYAIKRRWTMGSEKTWKEGIKVGTNLWMDKQRWAPSHHSKKYVKYKKHRPLKMTKTYVRYRKHRPEHMSKPQSMKNVFKMRWTMGSLKGKWTGMKSTKLWMSSKKKSKKWKGKLQHNIQPKRVSTSEKPLTPRAMCAQENQKARKSGPARRKSTIGWKLRGNRKSGVRVSEQSRWFVICWRQLAFLTAVFSFRNENEYKGVETQKMQEMFERLHTSDTHVPG